MTEENEVKLSVTNQNQKTEYVVLNQDQRTLKTLKDSVEYDGAGMAELITKSFNDNLDVMVGLFGSGFEIKLIESSLMRGMSDVSNPIANYGVVVETADGKKEYLGDIHFNEAHLKELNTVQEAKDMVLIMLYKAAAESRGVTGEIKEKYGLKELTFPPLSDGLNQEQKESFGKKAIEVGFLDKDFFENFVLGNYVEIDLQQSDDQITDEERNKITRLYMNLGLGMKSFSEAQMSLFKENLISVYTKHKQFTDNDNVSIGAFSMNWVAGGSKKMIIDGRRTRIAVSAPKIDFECIVNGEKLGKDKNFNSEAYREGTL